MTWDKKGGEGRWTEYINEDTGESSLKIHELKIVKTWCPAGEHHFLIVDSNKRLAKCRKCGQELTFVVGRDRIEGEAVYLT